MHFIPLRRIREVFTIEGLCSLSHVRGRRVHTCCAKVSTRHRVSGDILTGYVIDETRRDWRVQLENNTVVDLPRLTCSRITGKYTLDLDDLSVERIITIVWPVRFLLFECGEYKMTLVCYRYFRYTNMTDTNKCS